MTRAGRLSHWPTVVFCGLVWAILAVASLVMPWFVVFAVMLWVAMPVAMLVGAGLAALAPAWRADASAVARGVGIFAVLAILPSVLVVLGAVAQMNDNYF